MKTSREARVASQYEIDIVPNEHGGFYARIPDFPTIFTGGSTPEETMKNSLEAIELMIEEYQDRGLAVPEQPSLFRWHLVWLFIESSYGMLRAKA